MCRTITAAAAAHRYLKLMRLTTAGTYDDMPIAVFDPGWRVSPETCGQYGGDAPSPPQTYAITNADQGVTVVVGWMSQDPPIMAVTAGTSVSIVNAPFISNQQTMSVVQPVLQAQDGSYIGTIDIGWDQNNNTLSDMVSFDQTGAIRWMVPGNYQPQIATADGGLIATDPSGAAYTFDQNGNATGVLAGSPVQSFMLRRTCRAAGASRMSSCPHSSGRRPSSRAGGNPSGNGTSVGVFESVESLPARVSTFIRRPASRRRRPDGVLRQRVIAERPGCGGGYLRESAEVNGSNWDLDYEPVVLSRRRSSLPDVQPRRGAF